MSREAPRLTRLARVFGGRVPEERWTCPTCEPPAPSPEPLERGTHDFIEGLVARVGREARRDICLRVLPPNQGPCARGGTTPRQCLACQVQDTKDVCRASALTADEQARLATLLATWRRREREGREHDA